MLLSSSRGRKAPSDRGLDRRALVAALACLPCGAGVAEAAPASANAWLDYEARLRARLLDAGGGVFDLTLARTLLAATNAARNAAGTGPCAWDEDLAMTARAHGADLAARNYFNHVTAEGFDPPQRVGLLARRMIGSASENLSYRRADDPTTATQVMEGWRGSPPHWSNLLRPVHTRAGYGVVTAGKRTYSVGLYAQPYGSLGVPLPFRVQAEAELSEALSSMVPAIEAFTLSDPADDRSVTSFAQGRPPTLAPGAYQLRPRRRLDDGWVDVLWGPIFVRL